MINKYEGSFLIFLWVIFISFNVIAQNEASANKKIKTLSSLIAKAKAKNIDTSKEVMAINTAQIFLKYAKWDSKNVKINEDFFKRTHIYKENAKEWSKKLPKFEIKEVNLLLDEVIATLNKELKGIIKRAPTQKIDWSNIEIKGNKLVNGLNGKPVFLADWVWKPQDENLSKFYGNMDGFFIHHGHIINKEGQIGAHTINKLKNKPSGNFGSAFLGHLSVPQWAKQEFDGIENSRRHFTAYDIDNPGAREMQNLLLKSTLPQMSGKKYASLFMLSNEPHWYTMADTWDTGSVSKYTYNKFKVWLQEKHHSIEKLNSLWNTNFTDFNSVVLDIPLSQKHKGTPIWYDWVTFNQYRVTNWFSFLNGTVKKYAPNTKTHIKVMTHLWSENKKDHGIDLEAITEITDVIGNDAQSYYSLMWGDTSSWDRYYSFHWNELSMSYDFLKSVSPNKINYNSEGHFLSTVHFRDLEMKPQYARMSYWLAVLQGMDMVKTWFWLRNIDGSLQKFGDSDGYAGSNMQQPRIMYEVTSTMMDINAHAETIDSLQNLPSPLRIFYSKTSAINKENHMDDIRELYENIYFEGIPIGFVTEKIIKKQNNTDWETVLITSTPNVTESEFIQLQKYIDRGGTILMDRGSLKFNEYGIPFNKSLQSSSYGKVIVVNEKEQLAKWGLNTINKKGLLPKITLQESNKTGAKGCVWRSYTKPNEKNIITIVNIGKEEAQVSLKLKDHQGALKVKDLLKGRSLTSNLLLKSQEVMLLEIEKN